MAAGGTVQSFMVCGTRFDIDSRYQLIKPIGQGAYGIVCSGKDRTEGVKVAIKKIGRVFDHLTDAKRTLREIKLLQHLKHENVIAILDIMKPPSLNDFNDLYLVMELMETDLHQIITSPQPLSDDHCQYFLYQVLRGMKYIHSAHILHRDLKPSNLLLNGNCDLKICDFGLARIASPEENHAGFLTEYVATRWYRAPEVMLSWKAYTQAIDVWSIGCIFAEMLGRKPLFPGTDYINQLTLITDTLGSPSEEDLANIESDKARRYMKSLPHKPKIPFARLYPNATPLALDLLEGLLTFDPGKRLTVEQALEHPYLATLHDPMDEPVADMACDFSFEKETLTKEALRKLVFEAIYPFHPELEAEEAARSGLQQLSLQPTSVLTGGAGDTVMGGGGDDMQE